jgi:ubiquinone/menaquinone biosynthesis C-methylase UbiE
MTTKIYDNEKVIFGRGHAGLSYTDQQRGFLLFFKKELEQLEHKTEGLLKVLDIGCGAGAKTKALKAMFPSFKFQGCDISRQAIKEAKMAPSGVDFFVADTQKLPIKSRQFDVVIMHSVLDHTRKPEKAVKEAYRVLKKKGVFLANHPLEAETSTIHGQLTRFKSFRKHRENRCGHIHAFSKSSLLGLIRKAGFKIEKVSYDWFYFTQAVDVIYYPLLALTGKGPEFTLKQYSQGKTLGAKAAKYLRTVFTILENIESTLTRKFPVGFFVYIRAKKS